MAEKREQVRVRQVRFRAKQPKSARRKKTVHEALDGDFVHNGSADDDGDDGAPPAAPSTSQGFHNKAGRPKGSRTKPRKREKKSLATVSKTKDWFATEHIICNMLEECRTKWPVKTVTEGPPQGDLP